MNKCEQVFCLGNQMSLKRGARPCMGEAWPCTYRESGDWALYRRGPVHGTRMDRMTDTTEKYYLLTTSLAGGGGGGNKKFWSSEYIKFLLKSS